jgi:hypothetical protein
MTTRAVGTVLRPTTAGPRRRARLPAVAAGLGLFLAVAWAALFWQQANEAQKADRARAQQSARTLIELMRVTVQSRAVGDAQMLAQDPRLQSTLAVSNVDDATILDILLDLQKLNAQTLFAVLSPAGRVRVVLGAPRMKGIDLSTSAVVKTALAQETAALGTWMVDDRVEEVAVISVRAGERVVALLAIGSRIDDEALASVARAAGVHLALLVDEQPVWSDAKLPSETWFASGLERIDVKGSVPPAIFVAAAPKKEIPSAPLVWAVPALALVFSLLAFWRGAAR